MIESANISCGSQIKFSTTRVNCDVWQWWVRVLLHFCNASWRLSILKHQSSGTVHLCSEFMSWPVSVTIQAPITICHLPRAIWSVWCDGMICDVQCNAAYKLHERNQRVANHFGLLKAINYHLSGYGYDFNAVTQRAYIFKNCKPCGNTGAS